MMKPLRSLALADLLREVRTAERLAVAIPTSPREEAEMHIAAVESLRAARVAELERRAKMIEAAGAGDAPPSACGRPSAGR